MQNASLYPTHALAWADRLATPAASIHDRRHRSSRTRWRGPTDWRRRRPPWDRGRSNPPARPFAPGPIHRQIAAEPDVVCERRNRLRGSVGGAWRSARRPVYSTPNRGPRYSRVALPSRPHGPVCTLPFTLSRFVSRCEGREVRCRSSRSQQKATSNKRRKPLKNKDLRSEPEAAAAPLAQPAEHLTLNQRVGGSSPPGGTCLILALLRVCGFLLGRRRRESGRASRVPP